MNALNDSVTILILEDDLKWFEIYQRQLPTVYNLIFKSTIEGARLVWQQNQVDLIITDLKLTSNANKNAWNDLNALVATLKNETKLQLQTMPIIVVTGYENVFTDFANVLNYFGGWIWGWHLKTDQNLALKLQNNIDQVISHRKAMNFSADQELLNIGTQAENLTINDWWLLIRNTRPAVMYGVLAALGGLIGLAYTLGRWIP